MAGTAHLRERCSTYIKDIRGPDEYILWKLNLCALIAILDVVAIGNLAWLADVAFVNTLHLDYYQSGVCHNTLLLNASCNVLLTLYKAYCIWGLIVVSPSFRRG